MDTVCRNNRVICWVGPRMAPKIKQTQLYQAVTIFDIVLNRLNIKDYRHTRCQNTIETNCVFIF